jgi:hypothetical protein
MTTQPKPLRLADALDAVPENGADPDLIQESAAELRRLHEVNERLRRFELANNLWHEKTDWVQETVRPLELGRHRADVLKQRIERLQEQRDELLAALKLAVRQNDHDMLMTQDELRICRAAIKKAEGK